MNGDPNRRGASEGTDRLPRDTGPVGTVLGDVRLRPAPLPRPARRRPGSRAQNGRAARECRAGSHVRQGRCRVGERPAVPTTAGTETLPCRIAVFRPDLPARIEWRCTSCGDEGVISGREGTFDLRAPRPEGHSGAVTEVVVCDDVAAALRDLHKPLEARRELERDHMAPDGRLRALDRDLDLTEGEVELDRSTGHQDRRLSRDQLPGQRTRQAARRVGQCGAGKRPRSTRASAFASATTPPSASWPSSRASKTRRGKVRACRRGDPRHYPTPPRRAVEGGLKPSVRNAS